MINALQLSEYWADYYNNPKGEWLGFINSAYSLGAILSLPFVPILNERLGRRWSIFIGSWVMVGGAIIQCFAQNSTAFTPERLNQMLTSHSR
jgi:MFS family permease